MTLVKDTARAKAIETLRQVDGNVTLAAELLGISRSTFYRWLRRWGLVPSPKGGTERHVSAESDVSHAQATENVNAQRDVPDANAVNAVPQTAEPQELHLTDLRPQRTLSDSDMGSEATRLDTRRRGRPRGGRFLSDDRWQSLVQAAIDLSYLLRRPVTPEEVLALLVDTKLPDLLTEASAKREGK